MNAKERRKIGDQDDAVVSFHARSECEIKIYSNFEIVPFLLADNRQLKQSTCTDDGSIRKGPVHNKLTTTVLLLIIQKPVQNHLTFYFQCIFDSTELRPSSNGSATARKRSNASAL